jgi:hypothetical protein
VIQASHVSTGTTNNALALNPSGGNVGVGTTAPLTSFHILNSTADASSQLDNAPTSHILLRNTKTGSSPYSMGIGVDQTTGAGYINAAGNGAIQPVCLQTRGGNVGIGTTNPAVALDVVGNIRTTGNITQGSGVFFKNSATATSYMTINGGDAFNSPFLEFVYGGTRRSYIGNATANDVQIACEGGAQLSIMTAGSSRMVVLPNGYVGIGTSTPGAPLTLRGPYVTDGLFQCYMTNSVGGVNILFAVDSRVNAGSGGWNTSSAIALVAKDNSTNRSINTAGTINASGADYAEYMTKDSDFSAQKGDILGVLPSGKLTNQFDAAIHFLLKSTNPCMVGGDVWGTEAIVGEKPKNPEESATEEEKAAHAAALAAWEARLEAERQKVDRMAFAGQVPVNIQGATPGNYIIPLRNADGSIGVAAVAQADMSFSQYQSAVGRVISILADGRANVIVKAV